MRTSLATNQAKNQLQNSYNGLESIKWKKPRYLEDLLKPYTPTRSLRLAGKLDLLVPATKRKTFADRSFSVYGPKLWNTLPAETRRLDNYENFKKSVKTHLFKQAFM